MNLNIVTHLAIDELTYQFLTAVVTLPISAVIKWNLNVTVVDKHNAFIVTIVAHALIIDSHQTNEI